MNKGILKVIGIILLVAGISLTVISSVTLYNNRELKYELKDNLENTLEDNFNAATHNFIERDESKYDDAKNMLGIGVGSSILGIILLAFSKKRVNISENECKEIEYIDDNLITSNEIADILNKSKKMLDLDIINKNDFENKKNEIKLILSNKSIISTPEEFVLELNDLLEDGIFDNAELKKIIILLKNNKAKLVKKPINKIKKKTLFYEIEKKIAFTSCGCKIRRKYEKYDYKDSTLLSLLSEHTQLILIPLILLVIIDFAQKTVLPTSKIFFVLVNLILILIYLFLESKKIFILNDYSE
ncbi:TPA: hypothetical protein ACY4SV_000310 [Clostridium perfringens]|uniref:hypothetical protein n=2 Tax=Clostridium perfringens TaxID=1502 RepID=UPI001A1F1F46|nr:hypothetical protein [Clostridium perfringens]HAT4111752.1 hypothetical protein [Clostridium perfringens]